MKDKNSASKRGKSKLPQPVDKRTQMQKMRDILECVPKEVTPQTVQVIKDLEDKDYLEVLCDLVFCRKSREEISESLGGGVDLPLLLNHLDQEAQNYIETLRVIKDTSTPAPQSWIRESAEKARNSPATVHPVTKLLFGPGKDAQAALAQCDSHPVGLDVFAGFQRLLTIQDKRLESLFTRQANGDKVREKDIQEIINSQMNIFDKLSKLQLELDMLQTFAERMRVTVQNTMVNFNSTMSNESLKGMTRLSALMSGWMQTQGAAVSGEVYEGELVDE